MKSKCRHLLLPALALCSSSHITAQVLGVPKNEVHSPIVQTIDRLFEAMRARDTAAIRPLFISGALLVSAHEDQQPVQLRQWTIDTWLQSLAAGTDPLIERIWQPEFRVQGRLATVWAPYDLHLGERFSHCGMDAFQLVLLEERWKITAITWTNRKSGCDPPPNQQ